MISEREEPLLEQQQDIVVPMRQVVTLSGHMKISDYDSHEMVMRL
jgi:hypothetical protein